MVSYTDHLFPVYQVIGMCVSQNRWDDAYRVCSSTPELMWIANLPAEDAEIILQSITDNINY